MSRGTVEGREERVEVVLAMVLLERRVGSR